MKQKRKPLSYGAYLKKLNQEMQRHPNYQKGMRVEKVEANLYYLTPPEYLNPDDPEAMKKFNQDQELQMVLWDSVEAIDKIYSYGDPSVLEKRLPDRALYRASREGRGSVKLQSRLHSLYQAMMDYKQAYGSWPKDAAPFIKEFKIKDPWEKTEFLEVRYTAPAADADHRQVLAEYTRDKIRKFVLYTDGHQETWEI